MNKEEFIVDRIEDNNIIIESSDGIITISRFSIAELPKEGDVLVKLGETYKIDSNATARRKEKINKLMKGMWAE